MKQTKLFLAVLCCILLLCVAGAAAAETGAAEFPPVDYSDMDNWAYCDVDGEDAVDTFFVYPTIIYTENDYATIDETREKTPTIYEFMASAYEDSTNIYMPFYRQATMVVPHRLGQDNAAYLQALYENIPYQDVASALDYYFENYNNGKPFILASHSQGSAIVTDLLMHYMQEHPEYLDRMVAAYTLGFAPDKSMFETYPNLKFTEGESDFGVVVSWNTEGPDADGKSVLLPENPCVINPLNWKTDDTYAGTEENHGVKNINGDETLADARINPERGTVICTAYTDWSDDESFGSQALHAYDYGAYYVNIKENVRKRVDAYLAAQISESEFPPVDYSDMDNWAYCDVDGEDSVDTFFVYPTIFDNENDYATIEESKAAASAIYKWYASVYEKSTNIYVPYYRQTTMGIPHRIGPDNAGYLKALYENIPYQDIADALDYYFENFNNGKPFILAAHSQGSAVVTDVLMYYMQEHPEYLERMVAAYTLGYAPDKSMFEKYPNLKFAEGESDFGVVVSWNVEGPNAEGKTVLLPENPCVINPLNWKTDDTYAGVEENLGVKNYNDDETLADAQINPERGTVICTSYEDWAVDEVFSTDCLHAYDYGAYYMNIEENVQKRIDAYFAAENGESEFPPVDYSDVENWAYCDFNGEDKVDTFFVYPTIFEKDEDYATIEESKTAGPALYNLMASAYEKSTNIYMPYYRQTTMAIPHSIGPDNAGYLKALYENIPYQDIASALDYYFEHYNNGKPFILAAHSQGSAVVTDVLMYYMQEHPEYLERMVAAYTLGYAPDKSMFEKYPNLKFAEGESDFGVVVSWNTEGPNAEGKTVLLPENPCVINPLNWKTDDTYAGTEENLGVNNYNGDQTLADAQINLERGTVICTSYQDWAVDEIFSTDCLHAYDYGAYFGNIEANVQKRIDAYFAAQNSESEFSPVDYSDIENWAYCDVDGEDKVDTFFVYPTIFDTENDYATIEESKVAASAIYKWYVSAYDKSTNIYVPFYRQTTMSIPHRLGPDNAAYLKALYENIPYQDIASALDYYFEHYNNGKPFILAAHSQGSAIVTDVLMYYMQEHPEYLERMVAAYTLGYAPDKSMFEKYPNLKFAEGESDFGVVVSWNVEGPDASGKSVLLPENPCVINPLNWKTDDTYAGVEDNLGVKNYNDDETLADAQINPERGTVVTTAYQDWAVDECFSSYSLHAYDYGAYFGNIVENVQTRIDSYFAAKN